MPLARIDLSRRVTPDVVGRITESIYEAMTLTANVPIHDKFQIVTRHDDDELIYPSEGYLGVGYSPDIVFIQVTWVAGRSIEAKKAFYRSVADLIHERTGIRKEDVWITLVGNTREDWSFGAGEMQYAPVA
ncbi:tautomerase family protein [Luteibacter sp. CQ10]|uniref:tautomerase family protein n=1 Tax=Luteibacter sp. CQ10 TaxID=2805821 RepID=UPI0034A4F712